MDATLLSQKVFAGYGKAATRVGAIHDVYRPISSGAIIATANKIASVNAAFTVHGHGNFNFTRVSDYDKPLFHMLADPTTLRVGDYLNNPSNVFGPFFIASITPAMPPLAVQCNRVVSFASPGPACPAPGVSAYGATAGGPELKILLEDLTGAILLEDNSGYLRSEGNEALLMHDWPASVLRKHVMSRQYLPQDVGVATFQVLVPAYAGVTLRQGVVMTDDLGNRFAVQMAELQDFGWRLEVEQETL